MEAFEEELACDERQENDGDSEYGSFGKLESRCGSTEQLGDNEESEGGKDAKGHQEGAKYATYMYGDDIEDNHADKVNIQIKLGTTKAAHIEIFRDRESEDESD